jgi:hypothetical protein
MPYSRLQSGAGLLSPSRPRKSSSPTVAEPQSQLKSPGSFASVLATGTRSYGNSPCDSPKPASASQEQSQHNSDHQKCLAQHPWLDACILEVRVSLSSWPLSRANNLTLGVTLLHSFRQCEGIRTLGCEYKGELVILQDHGYHVCSHRTAVMCRAYWQQAMEIWTRPRHGWRTWIPS